MMRSYHLLLIHLLSLAGDATAFVRMCYFPNWSHTRQVPSVRFDIPDVDTSLCTHLIYAFAKVDELSLSIVPTESDEDSLPTQKGRYAMFNDLKKENRDLRTLLSVGGETAGIKGFVKVAEKNSSIEAFAKSTIDFLRTRNFDGLDIDWEFPGNPPETKQRYSVFLEILRRAFENEAKTTGNERLLLVAAVGAGEEIVKKSYDIAEISKHVDYLLIMAYDYAGSWNKITSFNSPLNPRDDPRFSHKNNQKWTVNELWIKSGAPASKIVVGMTGAGASFTLQNSTEHDVGSPVTGIGTRGELFKLEGRLIYPEICQKLKEGGTRVWDEDQAVPYAYWDDQWVGYDDSLSIKRKVQWMVKSKLGGTMFWAFDYDDFSGSFCNEGKFPLLSAMRDAAANYVPATLTPNVKPGVVVLTKGNSGSRSSSSLSRSPFAPSAIRHPSLSWSPFDRSDRKSPPM